SGQRRKWALRTNSTLRALPLDTTTNRPMLSSVNTRKTAVNSTQYMKADSGYSGLRFMWLKSTYPAKITKISASTLGFQCFITIPLLTAREAGRPGSPDAPAWGVPLLYTTTARAKRGNRMQVAQK